MHKPWYKINENEICLFFDVDPNTGLTKSDALARMARFGPNIDPSIPDQLLRQLNTTVLRDSKPEIINIKQLVPGDIVILNEGDRVPADIRLLQVKALSINQSFITGESLASIKNTYSVQQSSTLEQQKCMAFAGSFVVSGYGIGVVVARGKDSVIAKTPKKRVPRVPLRHKATLKRLQRSGVIIMKPRVIKNFKNISTVIIDSKLTDSQIIEIIRKVQLTKRITCKFIVGEPQAKKLAKELGVVVYDTEYPSADIINAQFIVNTDAATSVRLVSSFQVKSGKVLWVTDGQRALIGSKGANIVLAVGDVGRDDIRIGSDLLAIRHDATIITRILYS